MQTATGRPSPSGNAGARPALPRSCSTLTHPAGVEIGGTLLDPGVWGTGVNLEVKRLLLAVIFRHGAEWVQLRTDERNGRSAAAIQKLGVTELGSRDEHLVRRDGTPRRSRIFRIERPGPSMPAG